MSSGPLSSSTSPVNGNGMLAQRCRPVLLLAGLLTLSTALAGQLSVQAPVVDVEPIKAPPISVEHCDDKPAGGSLADTLAWDLGLNCRVERTESSAVSGYRVFYRWDDRIYSQVMSSAPGATIPLTVRLD